MLTNCYVVYNELNNFGILIDPGAYDKRIAKFIEDKALGINCIVNTHGHYDHIAGNNDFGYPVLIHENDKNCLGNPMLNMSAISGEYVFSTQPYRLLKEGDIVGVQGLKLKVRHTPGHTSGSITLECEDALFTGDTLFYESVGRTDIPFASAKDLRESIYKLMAYDDGFRIFPGHGPSSTIGHERRNNPFI